MKIKLSLLLLIFAAVISSKHVNAQTNNKGKIVFINDTTLNFNSLINKFKGKIVYVDIWATWCSPCRQELLKRKDIKAFQDFASKNDIVILYICCDKQDWWKHFVTTNKLIGYHILVNKYIDQAFHTTFSSVQNRVGIMKRSFYIPRHMIIDQSGAVVDSTVDRQGSASVYQKITQLINKPTSL